MIPAIKEIKNTTNAVKTEFISNYKIQMEEEISKGIQKSAAQGKSTYVYYVPYENSDTNRFIALAIEGLQYIFKEAGYKVSVEGIRQGHPDAIHFSWEE